MSRFLKCIVCDAKRSLLVYQTHEPLSITSDLRVWRSSVEVFQCKNCGHVFKDYKKIKKEVGKIYKSYQLFKDEEEHDQAIFIGDKANSRSGVIVEALPYLLRVPDGGKLLDVGCNKGILLREFSKNFPRWTVSGHEISKDYSVFVKRIPKLGKFYWGDISKIKERFDLITLIHTLEHVPNPPSFLEKLRKLLKPDGVLLVEVPNFSQNAFDILVYEHISHFFPQTLEQLFVNTGFEVVVKSQQVVPKELTFIVKISGTNNSGKINFSKALSEIAAQNINFLNKFLNIVKKTGNKNNIIVFGTAEVGTWVGGLLEDKISFFVDESPWRVGKKHLGIPIRHPRFIKNTGNVILAMAPVIAKKVYNKWKSTGARFWYPF